MKLFHATTLLALLATTALAEPQSYGIDPTHTDVIVSWNHAGFSRQVMSFHQFEGTLNIDLEDISATTADFTIPVASLFTGVGTFDNDLKGPGFFDVENHPTARFVSRSVEQTGDMTASVMGDLTVKGITKPATFDVIVNNIGEHPVGQFLDAYKGNWIGFSATAKINRSDWGVDFFIPIGSDEVEITINTEAREGGFSF